MQKLIDTLKSFGIEIPEESTTVIFQMHSKRHSMMLSFPVKRLRSLLWQTSKKQVSN